MPNIAGMLTLNSAFGTTDAVVLEFSSINSCRGFLRQFTQTQPPWLNVVPAFSTTQAGTCNHRPHGLPTIRIDRPASEFLVPNTSPKHLNKRPKSFTCIIRPTPIGCNFVLTHQTAILPIALNPHPLLPFPHVLTQLTPILRRCINGKPGLNPHSFARLFLKRVPRLISTLSGTNSISKTSPSHAWQPLKRVLLFPTRSQY